jgi:hypothetical protein
MQVRCPNCSAAYEVPKTERPRKARCKCGATFLMGSEAVLEEVTVPADDEEPRSARTRKPEPKAPPRHNVRPKQPLSRSSMGIGIAMMVFNMVWGALTRGGVVAAAGNFDEGHGSIDALFFGYVLMLVMLPTVIAGVGLIMSKAWGWWFGLVIQAGVLLLSGKFLWAYLGSLNWDHPKADDVVVSASLVYGVPFLMALAFLTGLFLPSVRLACGVKSKPLPKRRSKRAGTPHRSS